MPVQKYLPELNTSSTAGCILAAVMLKKSELLPKGFRRSALIETSTKALLELLVVAAFQAYFELLDVSVYSSADGHRNAQQILIAALEARAPVGSIDGEVQCALRRGSQLAQWVLFAGSDRNSSLSFEDFHDLIIAPMEEEFA